MSVISVLFMSERTAALKSFPRFAEPLTGMSPGNVQCSESNIQPEERLHLDSALRMLISDGVMVYEAPPWGACITSLGAFCISALKGTLSVRTWALTGAKIMAVSRLRERRKYFVMLMYVVVV